MSFGILKIGILDWRMTTCLILISWTGISLLATTRKQSSTFIGANNQSKKYNSEEKEVRLETTKKVGREQHKNAQVGSAARQELCQLSIIFTFYKPRCSKE